MLTDCQYVDAAENDGDSFRLRCGDKEFTARLYYVDAPETNLRQAERTRDQSIHFDITLDETMKAGEKATQRVKELLQKPFVIWTRWATAGGRGRESRYSVIVEVDKKSLAETLVSEGLARTKGVAPNLPNGEKAKAYMQRLRDLEIEARQKRAGAWANATTQKPEATPTAGQSQKTQVRQLSIVFAEEEPQDSEAKESGHIQDARCGEETRKSSAIF